jgi:hypothetical protein
MVFVSVLLNPTFPNPVLPVLMVSIPFGVAMGVTGDISVISGIFSFVAC